MTDKTEVQIIADELGISYHHRAGDATIQKLIDSHREAMKDPNAMAEGVLAKEDCIPMDHAEYAAKYQKSGDKRRKCAALVRCRIQNMNPVKKEWTGEFFSVGSAKLGTFKKMIPYNSSEPYHIPKIMYDMLVEKKCTVFHTDKDDRGNSVRKGRLVNEFAIEVLPPLTPAELEELGRTQALQAGQA